MSRVKLEFCDECRFDGGQHFDADGHVTRPHLDAALAKAHAVRVVELAHEQQTAEARRIIHYHAIRSLEFSANTLRQEMTDAGIDGPVIGAAFNYAETQGWIEATGRTVPSTEATTRHRINVWRSLIWTAGRATA